MSEFGDLEKKSEACAKEHPEHAGEATSEVAGIAGNGTNHQHDEQIHRAVDAAHQHIGQDQGQQDNQNEQKTPRERP